MAGAIRLKALLRQRHWQTYRTFCAEYDKVAETIDEDLVGTWPSRAQLHRWLSGDLKGLPYPDHCRILEGMFPGWTAEQLFTPIEDDENDELPAVPLPRRAPTPASELITTIAAGLKAPQVERTDWGVGLAPSELGDMDAADMVQAGHNDGPAEALGRRLINLGRVRRLSAEETRQLATLAGQIVNLGLDVTIEIESSGQATVTYRHELLNLSTKPVGRISHELWFEYTDGSLRLAPVNQRGQQLLIKEKHGAPNLANFSIHISPEIGVGEMGVVEFVCEGPRFIQEHYWRQCMMRYVRHLNIELHHHGVQLVTCSAVEEYTDGTEANIDDSIIRENNGNDVMLTVARDYLRPNQYVTLRWEVGHEPA